MKYLNIIRLSVVLFCIILTGLCGCTEYEELVDAEIAAENRAETRADFSYAETIYHEGTDSWIRPRKDPYALDNFLKTQANISSGKSTKSLTAEQVGKLSSIKLKATHLYVKIYPKTEKEQSELELMSDIKVSYIPFDHIQLPETQVKALKLEKSAKQVEYPEKGRYTVTREGYVSEYGPVEPETFTLPILYAVWPCDKLFPADMDYEILYDVFLPEKRLYKENAEPAPAEPMEVLESEAIRHALGDRVMTRASDREWEAKNVLWFILHYDNTMDSYVPLANLLVLFQLGSQVWDSRTDSEGILRINCSPYIR